MVSFFFFLNTLYNSLCWSRWRSVLCSKTATKTQLLFKLQFSYNHTKSKLLYLFENAYNRAFIVYYDKISNCSHGKIKHACNLQNKHQIKLLQKQITVRKLNKYPTLESIGIFKVPNNEVNAIFISSCICVIQPLINMIWQRPVAVFISIVNTWIGTPSFRTKCRFFYSRKAGGDMTRDLMGLSRCQNQVRFSCEVTTSKAVQFATNPTFQNQVRFSCEATTSKQSNLLQIRPIPGATNYRRRRSSIHDSLFVTFLMRHLQLWWFWASVKQL